MPSVPWIWGQWVTGSTRGRSQPRCTGKSSGAPAASSTRCVASTTRSTSTLPETHVTPSRSIAGHRTAKRSAKASSTPVSTSKMQGRGAEEEEEEEEEKEEEVDDGDGDGRAPAAAAKTGRREGSGEADNPFSDVPR